MGDVGNGGRLFSVDLNCLSTQARLSSVSQHSPMGITLAYLF